MYSKLCGSLWQEQLHRKFDPKNQLSKEFDKLKRKKSNIPLLEQLVRDLVAGFKDNVNTHSYDNLVQLLINQIVRLVGV